MSHPSAKKIDDNVLIFLLIMSKVKRKTLSNTNNLPDNGYVWIELIVAEN